MGRRLREQLTALSHRHPILGDVRGAGLMIGLEINRLAAPMPLRGSVGGMLASRLANDPIQPIATAFTPDKPDLIRLLPPLTISEPEIDRIVEVLSRSLDDVRFPKLIAPFVLRAIHPRTWIPNWFS